MVQQTPADACVLAGHPAAFSLDCVDIFAIDRGAVEWLPSPFDAR